MATIKPPVLTRHDATYWQTEASEADVLAWFRSRPEWHEWQTASHDLRKTHGEYTRFYHRPPGAPKLPGSGVVLERRRAGGVWLRVVGNAPERATRILQSLEAPAEPQPEQLELVEVAQ